jgi:hypothetical protein
MKRFVKILGLLALFVASFIVFAYLTFPYEVLKESLATQLSEKLNAITRLEIY